MTDQVVFDRYNAVMGTAQGQKAYGTLAAYAKAFLPHGWEHLQFMNMAISAALERCGMTFYRGATLRAVLMSPSHHVDEQLDAFLLLFNQENPQ